MLTTKCGNGAATGYEDTIVGDSANPIATISSTCESQGKSPFSLSIPAVEFRNLRENIASGIGFGLGALLQYSQKSTKDFWFKAAIRNAIECINFIQKVLNVRQTHRLGLGQTLQDCGKDQREESDVAFQG